MINTMDNSSIKVPSEKENEFCHFCFTTTNLCHLFPFEQYIQPDVQSFIDNFLGIQLSSEIDTNFTLCERCLGAIEFFIGFRDSCRKHYETLRGTRRYNQVLEYLYSCLSEAVLPDDPTIIAPVETSDVNDACNDDPPVEVVLEQLDRTTVRTIVDKVAATPAVEGITRKRLYEETSGALTSVTSRKVLKPNEERSLGKGIHIRALMRRASAKCRPEISSVPSPRETPVETEIVAALAPTPVSTEPSVAVEASPTVNPSAAGERSVSTESSDSATPSVATEGSASEEAYETVDTSAAIESSITNEAPLVAEESFTSVSCVSVVPVELVDPRRPVEPDEPLEPFATSEPLLPAESSEAAEPAVVVESSLATESSLVGDAAVQLVCDSESYKTVESTPTVETPITLNEYHSESPRPAIVSFALDNKPKACQPCFVGLKKLDIRLYRYK